ncbi:alpha/beta fold hydrolase [Rhodobacter capsulatus]|uniref:Alpha/beta fold hydrolase n=2 Tax=Rhodobacter capsulatus TaxID=1061 RepID=A0A4U1K2C0_RHOCA|nr:alpha/beta fold hydrolase [Rhodobacter capsulatus]
MQMRVLVIAALVALVSCAPRGELAYTPEPSAHVRPVFVGSTRGLDPETGAEFGITRSETLQRARFVVSVPPDRRTGQLHYPLEGRRTDPQKDFLLAGSKNYPDPAAFQAELRQSLKASGGEAVVFVHGFNNTFAEGLYRLAQMGVDFDLPRTLVYYAWPSRGHVLGYAYDRDSAIFARDGLRQTLRELERAGAKRILLVGHSMGSSVTMETLRDIALSGETETFSHLAGVLLISPDIDVDMFREQARTIGTLPQPFVIFTSRKDKALRLSSKIAGERDRLGTLQDISRVADLKVTMIDTGAFSTADGHFNVANNPALIRMLGRTGQLAKMLEGEQTGKGNLATGVVLTVQEATRIVLSPITALGGGN